MERSKPQIKTIPKVRDPAKPTDHRQATGKQGETIASCYLFELGYELIARNVRTRNGELDIICADDHTLVVVEVKCARVHRPARPQLDPLESINARKRLRVRSLTSALLAGQPPDVLPDRHFAAVRFDAIGVTLDRTGQLLKLDHVKSAF